jgi:hypothetical protein
MSVFANLARTELKCEKSFSLYSFFIFLDMAYWVHCCLLSLLLTLKDLFSTRKQLQYFIDMWQYLASVVKDNLPPLIICWHYCWKISSVLSFSPKVNQQYLLGNSWLYWCKIKNIKEILIKTYQWYVTRKWFKWIQIRIWKSMREKWDF